MRTRICTIGPRLVSLSRSLSRRRTSSNKFPRFNCGVGSCTFSGFAAPWLSEGKTFAITDNFTINRGSHTFKFGGLWNRNDNRPAAERARLDQHQLRFQRDNLSDTGNSSRTCCSVTTPASIRITVSSIPTTGSTATSFMGRTAWRVNEELHPRVRPSLGLLGPTYTLGEFLAPYFDPGLYDRVPGGPDRHHIHWSPARKHRSRIPAIRSTAS